MLLCVAVVPVWSQTPPSKDDPAHNELRALRDGLLDAMNKGDVERELTYLHPNVVVTWHDATVSRGRDGVRAYLNRTLKGPDKVVDSYKAEVDVDELTILYGGDTGISFGSAREHFKLARGGSLDLKSRWSATMVKEGDKWLIASLHASDDLFDNPLLDKIRTTAHLWIGAALVVGLVVGFLLGRRRPRA